MSIIFDARLAQTQAQTHALIVGVGEYPYLPGGTAHKRGRRALLDFGLGQLTSTVVAATDFANWVLTKLRNPTEPLGSVNLLLSPRVYAPSDAAAERIGVPAGIRMSVDLARALRIKSAFEDWFLKLDTNSGNIGLFLFAGDGLEAAHRYLLPADYGDNRLGPFDKLLNFGTSYDHMDVCKALTQIYFLDACRDSPQALRNAAGHGRIGIELLGPLGRTSLTRDAPVFDASTKGRQTGGNPGQISHFTGALIECLDGIGARDASAPDCPVNHASLGTALKERFYRVGQAHGLGLGCQISGLAGLPVAADVHLAKAPVQVMTVVQYRPSDAHAAATRLWIEDCAGNSHEESDIPRPSCWRAEIPAGKCTVEATFHQNDRWEDFLLRGIANPPLFNPICVVKSRAP